MSDLEAFRQEAKTWLEANCPQSMRTPIKGFEEVYSGGRHPEIAHPDQVSWCERMAGRGWTVPHWPKAYGGGGLDKSQIKVLREEMARIGARPAL
ncbi:MAG: acyl-CoA dehydrogenase family protein, partial [Halioglobus sp.]|nr:acyl-CoA dehydrogenase family protein [Halioglobus sp.]